MVNLNKPSASKPAKLEPSQVQLSKKNSFTDRATKLIQHLDRLDSSNEHHSTTEQTKVISSLLLPSQYIDLSLFFYSPNQDRDNVLQTSTDSSVLTSSTLSNSSASSVSNASLLTAPTMTNLTNSSEDEHRDLVAEMDIIERLPTQERLKQAKRRRALQLKKWNEYDSRGPLEKDTKLKQNSRNLKFQHHVVLLDAIMRKDCDEVEHLLQSGITPNSANEDGLTAIHQCCIDDSADLLKLLIKYGADVNVCDNDLWTPLHAAATCANLDICKILIENNADLLAVNTDGNMPYDICEDEVCLEYIESEMASRGVTQQTIDIKRSETEFRMLDDLKSLCFSQIFEFLKKHPGKKLTLKSLTKNIQNSFFLFFNEPVNADGKLDLNSRDHNGATLLHIAAANGYNSVIEFLLFDIHKAIARGAPIIDPSLNEKDNDGWTPLHVATFWGHQRAIELFLEAGAEIDLKTKNEETVIDLCDDSDVREFIIQKSKEIETEQEQKKAAAKAAAAAAVMQSKLQLVSSSNNSLNNGSIKGNNSSSRSLKRTSTGVSRSSSVRRSSFREKEKAERKLETSFKEFLYVSEAQENSEHVNSNDSEIDSSSQGFINNQYSLALDEEKDQVSKKSEITTTINPIVINHKDHSDSNETSNSKKITSVVKIINNSSSSISKNTQASNSTVPLINMYESTPGNNKFIDDFNNNQLKLGNETNVSTLTTVSQIARIHSSGTYATQNGQNLVVSNYSSNSQLSTSTIPQNTSNNSNTISTSSIAIVDVSTSIKDKKLDENQTVPDVKINQPSRDNFDASLNDGVKYKFVSNQTIGVNKTSSEFDDFNMDSNTGHHGHHRFKCLKCCCVM